MKKTLLTIAAGLAVAGGAVSTQAATAPAGSSLGFVEVDAPITSDTRWTNNNVYILERLIFVDNNATLTIEPGTIVRGIDNTLSERSLEPGALVVTAGAKIVANGTPDDPIIFTSIDDDNVPGGNLTVPADFTVVNSDGNPANDTKSFGSDYGTKDYDPDGLQDDNGFVHYAQWGGVVVLGDAYVSNGTESLAGLPTLGDLSISSTGLDDFTGGDRSVGQEYIEGIDPINIPSLAGKSIYGGVNPTNDAGYMRFCSIRYGGFEIGAANEINSLTTGGAGSGTFFEFIESTFNQDDGFEWFGGEFNTRFLFSLYNGDDSFDGDEGYNGEMQFLFTVMEDTANISRSGYASNNNAPSLAGVPSVGGDQVIEFDGPEPGGGGGLPNTVVDYFNFTGIGSKEGFDMDDSGVYGLYNVVLDQDNPFGKLSELATTTHNMQLAYHRSDDNVGTDDSTSADWDSFVGYSEVTTALVGGRAVYTLGGLDPRVVNSSAYATGSGVEPTFAEAVTGADYAGFQRDNTFLSGWSQLEYLEVLPTDNIDRPEVTISVSGTDVTVSVVEDSTTNTGAPLYVFEKSTDKKTWTPIEDAVTDGDANDDDGDAGEVGVTDSGALVSGTPVFYRAYAL